MGIRSEILSKGPDGIKVPILEPGILLIVILTELFSLQNNMLLDCFNIKCNSWDNCGSEYDSLFNAIQNGIVNTYKSRQDPSDV